LDENGVPIEHVTENNSLQY